jgi:hypothetical protein
MSRPAAMSTKAQNEALLRGITSVLKPLLADIFTRLKALEAGGSLADVYRGAHEAGAIYRRGELLTDAGSLWLCLHETTDRPGKSHNWRLVAKGK